MRVLIVGCGYIGLETGRLLSSQGHTVIGLRRSARTDAELKDAGIIPFHADTARLNTLLELKESFDGIVHCAAPGGGEPQDYERTYVLGNQNLVAYMRACPPGKCLYTSSTGVYPQTGGEEVDEDSTVSGTTATNSCLLQAEKLLLDAFNHHQLPIAILRVAGIYGPGRGYWWRQFVNGEARVEGSGDRFMNMIHRRDVAGAIAAALTGAAPGRIYNLVDNEPVRQIDVFRWLAAKLGRDLPPSVSTDALGPRRRGLTSKRVLNRRLRQELAYTLRYPTFREGFCADYAAEQSRPPAL